MSMTLVCWLRTAYSLYTAAQLWRLFIYGRKMSYEWPIIIIRFFANLRLHIFFSTQPLFSGCVYLVPEKDSIASYFTSHFSCSDVLVLFAVHEQWRCGWLPARFVYENQDSAKMLAPAKAAYKEKSSNRSIYFHCLRRFRLYTTHSARPTSHAQTHMFNK